MNRQECGRSRSRLNSCHIAVICLYTVAKISQFPAWDLKR